MILAMIKTVFWIGVILLVYIYAGYPVLVALAARLGRAVAIPGTEEYLPEVTVVITARNEKRNIEKKILNTLALDYPRDRMEILVVSDHSTDGTDTIVRRYEKEGVLLLSMERHVGKTQAQNAAASRARGEILVFSDANAMYVPGAVRHLVRPFGDPDVGCVSGELCYVNPEASCVGQEENLYWRYEKFIKQQENRIGTILGANGSIYAVRKSDYVVLEKDIISDFIEPLVIADRGKSVVYESRAVSYETVCHSFREEMIRKRRIVSRSLSSVFIHSYLLNPFRNPGIAFQLISHKLLRWLSPVFLFMAAVANPFLVNPGFYGAVFLLQILFYTWALVGWMGRNRRNMPAWFFVPYYGCLLEWASLLGIMDAIRGKSVLLWEPIRS
jgi:cellulose synthase/poly-beta-1,6-N-acetylglucosamine synthase-like glycosyltransferase